MTTVPEDTATERNVASKASALCAGWAKDGHMQVLVLLLWLLRMRFSFPRPQQDALANRHTLKKLPQRPGSTNTKRTAFMLSNFLRSSHVVYDLAILPGPFPILVLDVSSRERAVEHT